MQFNKPKLFSLNFYHHFLRHSLEKPQCEWKFFQLLRSFSNFSRNLKGILFPIFHPSQEDKIHLEVAYVCLAVTQKANQLWNGDTIFHFTHSKTRKTQRVGIKANFSDEFSRIGTHSLRSISKFHQFICQFA